MGVVKLADYRPQLEVVEHRVADNRPVNQQDACKRICGAIRAYTGIRYRAWR